MLDSVVEPTIGKSLLTVELKIRLKLESLHQKVSISTVLSVIILLDGHTMVLDNLDMDLMPLAQHMEKDLKKKEL